MVALLELEHRRSMYDPQLYHAAIKSQSEVCIKLEEAVESTHQSSVVGQDVFIEDRYIDISLANSCCTKQVHLRVYHPVMALDSTMSIQDDLWASTPAMLWLGDGGYLQDLPCSIQDDRCEAYVRELKIIVVRAVDCTDLADIYSVYNWITSNSRDLNIDTNKIIVGGQSKGAELTMSLTQMLNHEDTHDDGSDNSSCSSTYHCNSTSSLPCMEAIEHVQPVMQLLLYPILDEVQVNTLTQASHAESLPPTWIGVASLDPCCEHNISYAHYLQQSNVSCDLVQVAGAYHGFDSYAPNAAASQHFWTTQITAIKDKLHLC